MQTRRVGISTAKQINLAAIPPYKIKEHHLSASPWLIVPVPATLGRWAEFPAEILTESHDREQEHGQCEQHRQRETQHFNARNDTPMNEARSGITRKSQSGQGISSTQLDGNSNDVQDAGHVLEAYG